MNDLRISSTRKLVYAAICLTLAMVLPLITGQVQAIGKMLLPMHFAIMLCGFMCGNNIGGLIGFISPLIRFIIFGMPPIFPIGIAMSFELAGYGFVSGYMFRRFKEKKNKKTYMSSVFSIIVAMIVGRVIWGTVMFVNMTVSGQEFGLQAFLSGAVLSGIPGIIAQIALIPPTIVALKKTKLI